MKGIRRAKKLMKIMEAGLGPANIDYRMKKPKMT